MNLIAKIRQDIENIKIQGATNIAQATLRGIKIAIKSGVRSEKELEKIGKQLAFARPTEPLAQNALRFIFQEKEKSSSYYLEKIKEYQHLIEQAKKQMKKTACGLIQNGATFLTHCHSSSVISIFKEAKKQGKNFKVYATETRPLFQGRKTVQELLAAGLKEVILIIDDVAPSLILDQNTKIKAVFVGADLLSEKGFVNKVGTLAIAYAAKGRNIPLYCFSTLLKYDPRPFSFSLLENRKAKEVWKQAPPNLKIYAPAFDFIPYYDNIRIVCEKGIIEGKKVKEEVFSLYPFLASF